MNRSQGTRVGRAMRLTAVSLCFLSIVAGCGGSGPPAEEPLDPELQRANEERERLRAEEPDSPMRVVRRRAFRPPQECGQGPYVLRVESLGARYSEDYEVYACSRHNLRGDVRVRREGEAETEAEARSFGWGEPGNERCVASEVERADAGGGEGGGSRASRGGRATRGGRRARATREAAPIALTEMDADFERCPEGMSSTQITSHWSVSNHGPAIQPGVEFTIEIWSTVPNDLDGAFFVIEQSAVPETMSADAWREYFDRYRDWAQRYAELSDRELAAGRSERIDTSASSEEPPPAPRAETRPPRPSANASWIAGYWHRAGEWVWMPGFWRVPESDVEQELTVRAPRPPPRARQEARETQPAPEAVWTPGYWQWDGATYVWVAGAWRIPPSSGQSWQAPSWRSAPTGSIFVPGGWTFSIGR